MITSVYLTRWRLDPSIDNVVNNVPELLEGIIIDDPYGQDGVHIKIGSIQYIQKYKDYFVAFTNSLKYICRFEDEEK